MKKLLLSAILLYASVSFGQDQRTTSSAETPESIYISIKPADGNPVVFNTQEELDDKLTDKIEKIKQLINENQNNPQQLQRLREDLWRFENAIVRSTN